MFTRTCIGLLVIIFLPSCTTLAQRQFQAMVATNQATDQQVQACAAAVYDAPEMAPLRSYIPLDVRQVSLGQLADPSYPTSTEIAAILAVHPRLQICRQQLLDGISRTIPGLVPVLFRSYAETDNDIVALTQRKLTWGQYVTRWRDRALATQSTMLSEAGRVAGGLQALHAIQQEQQNQAMMNLGTALIQAGQPHTIPGPGIMNTNCSRYGNTQIQCSATTY